jgi:hypothetical protein
MSKTTVVLSALCLFLGACLAEPVETGTATPYDEEGEQAFDDGHDHDEDIGFLAKGSTATVPKCGAPKVQVCHLPGGDWTKANTLCIAAAAVSAHQFHHGDSIGACAPRTCSADDEVCDYDGDCCRGFCAGDTCRTTCAPYAASCDSSSECCNGGGCIDGVCVPLA